DHRTLAERRAPVGVEQPAAVGLQQLADGDVDEEGLPRHREPPAHDLAVLDLAERIGHLDELVPRARDPEALLLEQVLPIHEDRRRRGMADAVRPAIPPAEVTERVDKVVRGIESARSSTGRRSPFAANETHVIGWPWVASGGAPAASAAVSFFSRSPQASPSILIETSGCVFSYSAAV